MSGKKQQAKKQRHTVPTQADQEQVQQQLAHYKDIAHILKKSTEQEQQIEALATITDLGEPEQLALMRALGKEQTNEAADVLQAIQTYTPAKEVRKEARRSLIRLEGSDIYPEWQPPAPPSLTAIIEETIAQGEAPRFWRGEVTDTMDSGEVQLMLFFEQGERYKEVRMLGFLLDFFGPGVKDFFTYVKSKRSAEKQIEQMRMTTPDIKFVSCSLDEARGLIDDALAMNKRNNTSPHPDFVRNRELVEELLEAEDEEEKDWEDDEDDLFPSAPPLGSLFPQIDFSEMAVSSFLNLLNDGEYGSMYDNLSSTSPLREGLPRKQWIARRRKWRQEALPEDVRIHFLQRRKDLEDEQAIFVEVGWSYAFKDTPETLPEIPTATLTSSDTGRHWFWSSVELVQDRNKNYIHDIIDEGQRLLNLPDEVLQERRAELDIQAQQRLQELQEEADEWENEEEEEDEIEDEEVEDEIEDEDEEEEEGDEEDLAGSLNSILQALSGDSATMIEVARVLGTALHYKDALIMRTPHDSSLYEEAYNQANAMMDSERAVTYARLWADNIPEQRALALAKLAEALILLAQSQEDLDEDQIEHLIAQAEQALRESMAHEKTPERAVLLAQTLIVQNKHIQEAEDLLKQALKEPLEPRIATLAHASSGLLAQERGEREQALSSYQTAAEISPSYPDIWRLIGNIQLALKQPGPAEQSFLRGIQEEPENAQTYNDLGQFYIEVQQDIEKAQAVLEQGLEQDPESFMLLATLARTYIKVGNLNEAEQLLEEAEEINPSSAYTQVVRQELIEAKKNRQRPRPPRPRQRKKR